MPEPTTEAVELSQAFSRNMRESLTADELVKVNERNATPEYAGACASHDFCDANELMLKALADVGRIFDQSQTDLMNAAWDLSRANGFKS